MGAELPNCCTVSSYLKESGTVPDTEPTLDMEAHEKGHSSITKPHKININAIQHNIHTSPPYTPTLVLNNYKSTPSKKRRRKSKKKRKSRHRKMKLKYKQEKRTQSLNVCYHNDTDDEEHDEILSATYHLLNEENQLFIGKHAAYFAETYSNDTETVRSNDSGDSVQSLYSNSSSNMTPMTPESPLCTLSGNHANIILSYSDFTFPMTTSPRSRTQSVPTKEQRHTMYSNLDECECVETCIAIHRVINALKLYSKYDYELLMKHIDIKHLVNDYQHILQHHLTQDLEINMGMEFDLIKTKINQSMKPCNIRRCYGHRRYKEYKEYKNSNDSFLTFMDSMHCFFMHSQDL